MQLLLLTSSDINSQKVNYYSIVTMYNTLELWWWCRPPSHRR